MHEPVPVNHEGHSGMTYVILLLLASAAAADDYVIRFQTDVQDTGLPLGLIVINVTSAWAPLGSALGRRARRRASSAAARLSGEPPAALVACALTARSWRCRRRMR